MTDIDSPAVSVCKGVGQYACCVHQQLTQHPLSERYGLALGTFATRQVGISRTGGVRLHRLLYSRFIDTYTRKNRPHFKLYLRA